VHMATVLALVLGVDKTVVELLSLTQERGNLDRRVSGAEWHRDVGRWRLVSIEWGGADWRVRTAWVRQWVRGPTPGDQGGERSGGVYSAIGSEVPPARGGGGLT